MDLTVVDVPEQQQYQVRTTEGEVAGSAHYTLSPDVVTFTHTDVDPARGGQGIGSTLARGALDDVRARGLRVTPRCSFIAGWIDKHPEYADLVV